MRKFAVLIVAIVCIFTLFSCMISMSYTYVNDAIGNFGLGYSERANNAFFGGYAWDGSPENMSIVLPEEYNGAKITGLGGYAGRGYPCPFMIDITSHTASVRLCPDADIWHSRDRLYGDETEVQYLNFDIHISKNIKEAENLYLNQICVAEYVKDGESCRVAFVLTYSFTCDAENKHFYAEDGKLYRKSDKSLVDEIFYEGVTLSSESN